MKKKEIPVEILLNKIDNQVKHYKILEEIRNERNKKERLKQEAKRRSVKEWWQQILKMTGRSKRQIIIDILKVLNQEKRGLIITKLMRKGGFEYNTLKRYLDILIPLGLIEKIPYKKLSKIVITPKGQIVNHHFFITNSTEKKLGFIL